MGDLEPSNPSSTPSEDKTAALHDEIDGILDSYANFKVWESQQDWEPDYDREANIANSRNIARAKLATYLKGDDHAA